MSFCTAYFSPLTSRHLGNDASHTISIPITIKVSFYLDLYDAVVGRENDLTNPEQRIETIALRAERG
jgi:hypothetical protein